MRRHDDDTIAALAEGRLEPDEAAAVEAALLADPEAARSLAAQRHALEATGSADPVTMSAAERSTLRSGVAARLGLEPGTAPVAHRRPRRRLAAIALSATALVAVLAATPLIGMLSTAGSGPGFDVGALRHAEQAQQDPAPPLDDPDSILPLATEGLTGDIGFGHDPESPPSTIVVDGTEPFDDDAAGDEPSETTAADLADELEAQRARAGAFDDASPVDDDSACAAEARALLDGRSAADLLVVEYSSSDGRVVLVFLVVDADSGEIETVTAFDPDGCVVVADAP